MQLTDSKRQIACSVAMGAVLSIESTAVCATYGAREVRLFSGPYQEPALFAVAIGGFILASVVCYVLLRNADALLGWAERFDHPRKLKLNFTPKSIAAVTAVAFVCWLPWIILQYPCAMNGDTFNQLYQFQTSSPTMYSTMGTVFDESYIDHHPVISTLIFGGFLTLGDALGSQNAGLFIYSLFQCALTAFALSASCCYLERLGVPKVFRFVTTLFVALLPPIPQWATCMVKDSLNAPFLVLFALMYIESLRTRGDCFKSGRFLAAFLVVSFFFIMTKKSSALVFAVSMFALVLVDRGAWKRTLIAAVVPLAVGFALVPALLYPAIGGVAPGGKQETFGFAFQQVVTAVNDGYEMTDSEREAVERVLHLDKARENIKPGIVDPVKNSAVREATTGDYLAFLPAYFSIGLRNPGAYTASVLNVCGPLITPLEPFSYFSTPEQKDTWIAGFVNADTKNELHLSFYKPDALEAVSDEVQAVFNDVADWHSPLLFFLTMGFYGGWMPLICLVLCLFYDRRGAVMLLPMLLCFGILVIGPASSVRYVLPLLYAAPLMMGVLCRAYGRARVGVEVEAGADGSSTRELPE